MPNNNSPKIIRQLTIFIIVLIGYYFFNAFFHIGIPCIFYKITHFYCPGCGATRMMFAILKLDFYQAFRYNPLVFILLIGYIVTIIYSLVLHKKINISNKVTYILLVIVILFGIIRNIPGFEFLLPTTI